MTNRQCQFCKAATIQVHDSEKRRAYECTSCLAVESITKGASSWWYSGTQQLDVDDAPGDRIDGEGKRAKAPIPFYRWAELATEGNTSVLSA